MAVLGPEGHDQLRGLLLRLLAAPPEPAETLPDERGELVAATPEAIAAVALSHLEVELTSYEAFSYDDDPVGQVFVKLQLDNGGVLNLVVRPEYPDEHFCNALNDCEPEEDEVGDGEVLEGWEPEDAYVQVFTDEQYAWVRYEDPRIDDYLSELDLDVTAEQLEAIVTDPDYGLRTEEKWVEAGRRLE